MAHLEDLLGKEVIDKDGSSVPVSSLADCNLLGIFFSAHWCTPCRGFTETLVECYNKVKAKGEKWQIVFISVDKDEESCKQYYESMPWLRFPFQCDSKDKNENKSETLSEHYGVTEIPTLLLIEPQSACLITDNGLKVVEKDPSGGNFPWK